MLVELLLNVGQPHFGDAILGAGFALREVVVPNNHVALRWTPLASIIGQTHVVRFGIGALKYELWRSFLGRRPQKLVLHGHEEVASRVAASIIVGTESAKLQNLSVGILD